MALSKAVLPIGLAALVSVSLFGCALPAQVDAMIPAAIPNAKHQSGTVSISVTGGTKTNPMVRSHISDEDFLAALSESIRKTSLFDSIVHDHSTYQLNVQLIDVSVPTGAAMTATIVSEWQLIRQRDSTTVLDEFITSKFTATLSDAFGGITRQRLAQEGAARESISEGIKRLAQAELPL